jgi:hypothetical protein
MTEIVVEGGDEGNGSAKPSGVRDVTICVRVETVAKELTEAFTSLVRDVAVINGGKIIG